MQTIKYVFWEEDGGWLGYLQDYPDYWTQGETLDDLKEHLCELHADLTSGQPPGIHNQASRIELVGDSAAAETEQSSLPDAHKRELEKRLAAYESSPKAGSSWEEVKARLRNKDIADG